MHEICTSLPAIEQCHCPWIDTAIPVRIFVYSTKSFSFKNEKGNKQGRLISKFVRESPKYCYTGIKPTKINNIKTKLMLPYLRGGKEMRALSGRQKKTEVIELLTELLSGLTAVQRVRFNKSF